MSTHITVDDELQSVAWYQSLAFKVALCASALVVLATLGMTAVAYHMARKTMRDQVHQRLRTAVVDRQRLISAYITQQHERAALVASRTRFRSLIENYLSENLTEDAMRDGTRPILTDAQRSLDGFVDIWFCDPNGKTVTSTNNEYLGRDYSNSLAFQLGRQRQFLDDPHLIDGKHRTYLSAPAKASDGQLLGVVMILLDTTPLVDIIADRNGMGETGEVLVATRDESGVRYFAPRRNDGRLHDNASEAAAMDLAIGGAGNLSGETTTYCGKDVLCAYQPIEVDEQGNRNWGLVATLDTAEAYLPVRQVAFQLGAIAIALTIAFGAASCWMAVQATGPLRTLTSTALAISSGRLDMRAAISSYGECGILASAFNRQMDRLVELNANLESQVEERTAELKESETRFQQIASHLDDILWMTSADGSEIIYVSSAYEVIWGRSCDSLYKQPKDWADGIHSDDRERVVEAFYERAAQGGYDEGFRVVRPDGTTNWVHATGFPILNGAGEVYRVAGVARNVTESKESEVQLLEANEALRSTTAFQRAVLNSTAYSIITTDRDGLITTFNQGAERLLGYQADEVVGRVTPEFIHDKGEVSAYAEVLSEQLGHEVEPGFETFVAKARGGQADEHEWTYVRKDGSRVPVLLSVTAICDQEGDIRGFLCVAMDITRRKETERQLREAKQQAEKASLAKSEFLASMSHELRTPLNGVIGMTELLAGTDLDGKQRQFVDACRSSGEALLSLINDVLDFSKIEAGKLELDVHDFDLEKLVTDTVDTMAWRAAEKELETPCYVDQVSRTILIGDSARLRQILVNLVGNAIKFTETGEVAVRTETVAREGDQIRVRFSVSDTGIGIPADKLDRLFQSFSQVDASTTREYGGTGLGLAISQSLVELMDGRIGVKSEEGVGSTFWFEVPFAVVSESSEGVARTSPLAGRRTLIVDDNETNRLILAEYSAAWGAASVAAASVDEALAAVEQAKADGTPFEIVLTDYNMPQRNGLDLARALKNHPQLVVLLLGSTDIQLGPEQLREHGIAASLRKPVRRHELHDVICGLLGKGEQERASADPSATTHATLPASHILLAEDNSINQLYVIELMKQLGCTCDVVANGREATEAVQRSTYNLVLMDCQMPEMDGFEATRRIRQLESDGLLDGHLPIVALTANAVKGDRERCLDAGMDDYLAKPVEKRQVISVLEGLLTRAHEHAPETGEMVGFGDHTNDLSEPTPIDAESLLARCFGNLEFAGSLLDELESTGIQRVEEIRQHATQQNSAAAADAAHALKGAAGILCAEAVQKLAAEIEHAGRSSNIEEIEAELNSLSAEMRRCLDYVPQLRQELNIVEQKG